MCCTRAHRRWQNALTSCLLALAATACETDPPSLPDDPESFVEERAYRRAVLERDLWKTDNDYARIRLGRYALQDEGWDVLAEADFPSRAFTRADAAGLAAGLALEGGGEPLVPPSWPEDEAEWETLGRRVFFEYPIRADDTLLLVAGDEDALLAHGVLLDGDSFVGMRVFESAKGVRLGPTCAQCHVSADPAGGLSPRVANRRLDIGALRLLALAHDVDDLPPELDGTAAEDLARLGPGRADVLPDAIFNPYAFPGFAGYADLPYLHHTANWLHTGTATLAVRCETLFITSSGEQARIPRVLAWAVAAWLRSLPALPPELPLTEDDRREGERVFDEGGCPRCHPAPTFTSDRQVRVENIGTDAAAGLSAARGTGLYRVPSLRGVGWTAPYLHHGAVETLDELFDPARTEPGHEHGLDLAAADRVTLVRYLRGL